MVHVVLLCVGTILFNKNIYNTIRYESQESMDHLFDYCMEQNYKMYNSYFR